MTPLHLLPDREAIERANELVDLVEGLMVYHDHMVAMVGRDTSAELREIIDMPFDTCPTCTNAYYFVNSHRH